MTINYNSKRKMIRIEQYNQDPKRVGHELIVSLSTQQRIRSTQTLKPRKSKQPSIREILVQHGEILAQHGEVLKEILIRLDKVEVTLKDQKSFNEKVQTYMDTHP
jgi:hypothetical protein